MPTGIRVRRVRRTQSWIHTYPDGTEILMSYKVPVAAKMPDGTLMRTERWWSHTTQNHLREFVNRPDKEKVIRMQGEWFPELLRRKNEQFAAQGE